MELRLSLDILRRRWPIVVVVPLVVALLSLAVAVTRPPRYGLTARLLVTRAVLGIADVEDTIANDLPAIVGGTPFAQDVVKELAGRGHRLSQLVVEQSLHAENQKHVVDLSVTADSPDDAVAIMETALALIKANGLRYWGDASATPDHPGINIVVLDLPAVAALLNGPRAIALEVALRTLLGLLAAVGLAFALYYFDRWPTTDSGPSAEAHERLPLDERANRRDEGDRRPVETKLSGDL